jgi:hypothetical protein
MQNVAAKREEKRRAVGLAKAEGYVAACFVVYFNRTDRARHSVATAARTERQRGEACEPLAAQTSGKAHSP